MAKKHRYEGEYFKALYPAGSGELAVRCNTIEEMRDAINDANARAFMSGYKMTQYLVTHVEWYKYLDDDGQFVKREEYESLVEIYPATPSDAITQTLATV